MTDPRSSNPDGKPFWQCGVCNAVNGPSSRCCCRCRGEKDALARPVAGSAAVDSSEASHIHYDRLRDGTRVRVDHGEGRFGKVVDSVQGESKVQLEGEDHGQWLPNYSLEVHPDTRPNEASVTTAEEDKKTLVIIAEMLSNEGLHNEYKPAAIIEGVRFLAATNDRLQALLDARTQEAKSVPSFEQAWEKAKADFGYQYGEDALINVELGWYLRGTYDAPRTKEAPNGTPGDDTSRSALHSHLRDGRVGGRGGPNESERPEVIAPRTDKVTSKDMTCPECGKPMTYHRTHTSHQVSDGAGDCDESFSSPARDLDYVSVTTAQLRDWCNMTLTFALTEDEAAAILTFVYGPRSTTSEG